MFGRATITLGIGPHSSYYRIWQLCCIRPYFDCTTAYTTATSNVHFKLNYWNCLCYNVPKSQITRLQQIQSSLAALLLKLLNYVISLRSYFLLTYLLTLHWLKITESIEYKQTLVTYLQSPHNHPFSILAPPHLCSTSAQHSLFISRYPRPCSTTNIILVTYNWSLLSICLSCLWNQLPTSLRQPLWFACSYSYQTFSLCWLTTLTIFYSLVLFITLSVFLVTCGRLSWLPVSFWAHVYK